MNSAGILARIVAGPRSLTELAEHSGLSRTAVDAVIGDLVALGWVEAHEVSSGRPGRPATSYGLVRGLGTLASMDIGAHHVQALLAGLDGTPFARSSATVGEDDPPTRRLATALSVIDDLLASEGLRRDDVWILGVGSPGTIENGVVGHFGGEGMPGWVGLDIRSCTV